MSSTVMDDFHAVSQAGDRQRSAPLPAYSPNHDAGSGRTRMHESASPHHNTSDATGEPLMDDTRFGFMTDPESFAPLADASFHEELLSYSARTGQSMEELNYGGAETCDYRLPIRQSGSQVECNSSASTLSNTSPSSQQDASRPDSLFAAPTNPPEHPAELPKLQTTGPPDASDRLKQVNLDDPTNFDLLETAPNEAQAIYQLETRAQQLFSPEHLHMIFRTPRLLLQFTDFLYTHRPSSVRTLNLYFDALKALRAIVYANTVARSLAAHDSGLPHEDTVNDGLTKRAERAFYQLVQDDLPAWITYTWTKIVSVSIQRRITGTLAPHLREASEGLAEVFCLSDPSRPDNPIVFASEEFQRTTQYGLTYCVGRNCRFLQGPRTNKSSVERLSQAIAAGKEHSETFLNYRRDGSPFMNLLMVAPLLDSQGRTRYFIGAQIDVSGLVKDGTALEGLQRLLARQQDSALAAEEDKLENEKDDFQRLSEVMNNHELETVRKYGGKMHEAQVDDHDDDDRVSLASGRPRLLLNDISGEELDSRTSRLPPSQAAAMRTGIAANGRLHGVYQNYLLVRPAPTLRILFTSPSLRIPGILQSSLMSRIGGSERVRAELEHAFEEGRGVTAKVRWLTRARGGNSDVNSLAEEGRARWLHCTPLFGHTGTIGVWMVVLVDENSQPGEAHRRFRTAPPVAAPVQKLDVERTTYRTPSSPTNRFSNVHPGHENFPLASHPVGDDSYGTVTIEGSKRALAGTDSRTSSFYGVVPKSKRPIKDEVQTSPASTTSRPRSEISFALR